MEVVVPAVAAAAAMHQITITCGQVTRATATIKIDTMVKVDPTTDPNGQNDQNDQNDPTTTIAIDTVVTEAEAAFTVATAATMIIIRSISGHGIKPIGKWLQWKYAT